MLENKDYGCGQELNLEHTVERAEFKSVKDASRKNNAT
jgi:hypothetical protein